MRLYGMSQWADSIRDVVIFVSLFIPHVGGGMTGEADWTDASGSIINQLFLLFVFFASIFVARTFNISLRVIVFTLLPITLVVVWIFLSYTWSEYPELTIRRATRLTIEISSTTLLALSFRNGEDVLRALFPVFFVICLMDMAFLLSPLSFRSGGFEGVHGFKNNAGLFYFLALPVFGWATIRHHSHMWRVPAALALVIGGVMFVLTSSKSAFGCAGLASILVLATRLSVMSNFYGRVVLPLCCFGLAGLTLIVVFEVGVTEVLRAVFEDPSLTGRDEMWNYVFLKSEGIRIHGVGYGALWQIGPALETELKNSGVRWISGQAHNGYIDIVGQLGYIGLMLAIIYLIATFRRLLIYTTLFERSIRLGLADYALYVFWGAIIYNVTESSFFRFGGHMLWHIFVFVTAFAAGHFSKCIAAQSPAAQGRASFPSRRG